MGLNTAIGHHNIDIYEASRTTRHSARVPGVPAVLRGHDFSDAALERVRSEWPPGEGVVAWIRVLKTCAVKSEERFGQTRASQGSLGPCSGRVRSGRSKADAMQRRGEAAAAQALRWE